MRLALPVLALLLAASTAQSRVIVENDTAGGAHAELSYERSGDSLNPSFRDFAVRIYEDDALVLDESLTAAAEATHPQSSVASRRSPYVTSMGASPRS